MRAAREEAGWSLVDLAAEAGISHGNLSYLERDCHAGTIGTIEALADVLGLTIDEYIGHRVVDPIMPPEKVS